MENFAPVTTPVISPVATPVITPVVTPVVTSVTTPDNPSDNPPDITPGDPPSKIRDLAINSPLLQEVREQITYATDSRHFDVIGRVFHGVPGRSIQVSSGMMRADERPGSTRGTEVLHFGSYNYAGLNGHPRVLAAAERALQRYGTTVSGVRLLNGTCDLHLQLERRLAAFLGVEDCITYSSGYVANLSVLGALCGPDDVVLSDMLNHQSIIDGLKLSGA